MAITKTKFINYTRCPRYIALDDLSENLLNSDVSYEEYLKEEQQLLKELTNDIETDEQIKVMLPYYNEVEILAGKAASKYFDGTFKYAYNTFEQESFDCKINGIRYICYVDIYNENKDSFNIIEVKATTSKKFLDIKYQGNSIFEKINNVYHLLDDNHVLDDGYYKIRNKLLDRYDKAGHYVYDLAIQRYIIENDLKQSNKQAETKYYLAVLNADYVFDGKYENNRPVYDDDIITFFDLTSITKEYQQIIDLERKKLEKYITKLDHSRCKLGEFCENKKSTKCRYFDLCYDILPSKNSILTYLDNHYGFNKKSVYELINSGITNMLDVKDEDLLRRKNQIQKEVVKSHQPYFNINKIKAGLNQISYPIYHLDFETFPCPLPRYKGETPYTQSVFQFSLHIENEPGICDKIKNHYGYLAKDDLDHREELVKELIKDIGKQGTVLVYNESFEKTRLQELANIFPKYKDELLNIRSRVFDLMNIVKTNTKLYEKLGYSKEEASLFNYYHENMQGSFSIKKILPLFSDLTYQGMDIANGVDALVTYAKFKQMNKQEYEYKYNKLIEYCRQDTWAMFEILKGLRNYVK